MNKLIALILAFVFALGLVGCNRQETHNQPQNKDRYSQNSNKLFDITTEPHSSETLKIVTEKETYSIEDKVIKYSITNTSDFEQSIAGDDDCFSLQILVDGKWKRVGTKKEHYWNELGLILPSAETEQREIDLDEYFNLPLDKGTYRIAVENLASNTFEIF